MRRQPSLRAPFVLTIAATTALGCGVSVTPSGSVPADASVVTDAGAPTDRVSPTDQPSVVDTDVRRACPPTLPSAGAPCTPGVDPETCTDSAMTPPGCPPGTGTTRRCDPSTQRWQALAISCNPPPPVQCPPTRPTDGAECPQGTYLPTSLSCEYDLCGTRFATQATCTGPAARWSVQQSSCNPPAPVCPVAMPAPDAACSLPSSNLCEWGLCDGHSTSRGSCVGGRWSITLGECDLDAGAPPADI